MGAGSAPTAGIDEEVGGNVRIIQLLHFRRTPLHGALRRRRLALAAVNP